MNRRRMLVLCGLFVPRLLAQDRAAAQALYQQAIEAATPDQAVALLRRSIAAGPSFEAQYLLGAQLIRLQRWDEALDALRAAYGLTTPSQTTDRAHVAFRRAQAYEGKGRLRTSYQYAQSSLDLEDNETVRRKLYELQDRLSQDPNLDPEALREEFEVGRDIDVRPGRQRKIQVWVNFDVGKFSLTSGGSRQAEVLAGEMSSPANRALKFMIVGHTDKTGTDAVNDPLSLNRAKTVQEFVLRRGVPADRLQIDGRGSREPLRPGGAPEDLRANRRVEVQLIRG